jgi:preprotein translocase subunit YajC
LAPYPWFLTHRDPEWRLRVTHRNSIGKSPGLLRKELAWAPSYRLFPEASRWREGTIAALISAALIGLFLLHLDLSLIGAVTAIGVAFYFLFWRQNLKRHGFFRATADTAWLIFVALVCPYLPDPKTIFAFVERHWETLGERGQGDLIIIVMLVACFACMLPEIARKRRERAKQKAWMQVRTEEQERAQAKAGCEAQARERALQPKWDENSFDASGPKPPCPPSPNDLERARMWRDTEREALLAIPYEGQQLTLPL